MCEMDSVLVFVWHFSSLCNSVSDTSVRVSNSPGCRGNLLEVFFAGNPGILEFCQVSWTFHGAMAYVAIDMMLRWMLTRFFRVMGKTASTM